MSYSRLLKAIAFVIHIVYGGMLVKYTTAENVCVGRLLVLELLPNLNFHVQEVNLPQMKHLYNVYFGKR